MTFRNRAIESETLALVKGTIDPARPTLVRMHALDPFEDALSRRSERSSPLERAMKTVAAEGTGVVVPLYAQAKLFDLTRMFGGERLGEMAGLRDYGVGAQILTKLDIHDMVLLTNSHQAPVALDGYG